MNYVPHYPSLSSMFNNKQIVSREIKDVRYSPKSPTFVSSFFSDTYSVAVFVAILAAFTQCQSTQAQIPTECPKIDPKYVVHLPHPDCTKFYKCSWGKKFEQICPKDPRNDGRLHFNPVEQVCDWPEMAGCKNNNIGTVEPSTIFIDPSIRTTSPIEINTPSLPNYCPINTGGITMKVQHDTICNYYYLCIDGEKILQSCRPGNVFDSILHVCNFLDNVRCNGKKIMPPIRLAFSKCLSKGFGKTVKFPHEYQCDKYYECHNGNMILKECPSGLHYDWIREVCHLPSIVKCVPSIPPTSPSTIAKYDK